MSNKHRKFHNAPQKSPRPAGGADGGAGMIDIPKPQAGPLETALQRTRLDAELQQPRRLTYATEPPFTTQWTSVDFSETKSIGVIVMDGEEYVSLQRYEGEGLFTDVKQMIEYLEKKGYQVIQPVQELDSKPRTDEELEKAVQALPEYQAALDEPSSLAERLNRMAENKSAGKPIRDGLPPLPGDQLGDSLAVQFSNLAFDSNDDFRMARRLDNGNVMAHVQVPENYAEGVLSESKNQEITPGQFMDQRLQEALENYFISVPMSGKL